MRYAAGYVTKSIKQRYEKLDTDEAAEIVECLSQMAVEGPGTSFMTIHEIGQRRSTVVDCLQ